jgi:hypothetical protein
LRIAYIASSGPLRKMKRHTRFKDPVPQPGKYPKQFDPNMFNNGTYGVLDPLDDVFEIVYPISFYAQRSPEVKKTTDSLEDYYTRQYSKWSTSYSDEEDSICTDEEEEEYFSDLEELNFEASICDFDPHARWRDPERKVYEDISMINSLCEETATQQFRRMMESRIPVKQCAMPIDVAAASALNVQLNERTTSELDCIALAVDLVMRTEDEDHYLGLKGSYKTILRQSELIQSPKGQFVMPLKLMENRSLFRQLKEIYHKSGTSCKRPKSVSVNDFIKWIIDCADEKLIQQIQQNQVYMDELSEWIQMLYHLGVPSPYRELCILPVDSIIEAVRSLYFRRIASAAYLHIKKKQYDYCFKLCEASNIMLEFQEALMHFDRKLYHRYKSLEFRAYGWFSRSEIKKQHPQFKARLKAVRNWLVFIHEYRILLLKFRKDQKVSCIKHFDSV